MQRTVSGALATVMTLALTGVASSQTINPTYQQPAATSTYQPSATTAQPSLGSALLPAGNVYAPQSVTGYTAPAAPAYAAPQPVGPTFATSPAPTAAPVQQQPTGTYTAATQGFGSPYTPTVQGSYAPQAPAPTYVAPGWGSTEQAYQAAPVYQTPGYAAPVTSAPLAPLQPAPEPASAYTLSVPASTAPQAGENALRDSDAWSFNFARFYPAVQACLRRSTTKNPVIANIQVEGNQTMMLIGEGGSSSYSTCSTGLTGTTVKANSDIRTIPPAFFAPLGSTFTVSPERPFQPIVDTDQKVIGWLVRTQPSQAVNQFGQAAGFDGQFIPPMMVNTNVGKS